MKTIDTVEEALVGRTIKLSVIECLVIANLVNDMTGDVNFKSRYANVKTEDLANLKNLLIKITGQDIISLESAKEELFSPVGEEIVYDVDGNAVTSTVEAYDGSIGRPGEHKVGKIRLDRDDMNDLIESS